VARENIYDTQTILDIFANILQLKNSRTIKKKQGQNPKEKTKPLKLLLHILKLAKPSCFHNDGPSK